MTSQKMIFFTIIYYNNNHKYLRETLKNMSKIEVFRLTPEVGKYYEYVEYNIKEGDWPNSRYFTTEPPKYVGMFVRFVEFGYGDNKSRIDYFIDQDGKEVKVNYSYEGTTSFREVPQRN